MEKKITARWVSKCRSCGNEITKGSPCWYMPDAAKGHKLKCDSCHSGGGKGAADSPSPMIPPKPNHAPQSPHASMPKATPGVPTMPKGDSAFAVDVKYYRSHAQIDFDSVSQCVEVAMSMGEGNNPRGVERTDVAMAAEEGNSWVGGYTIKSMREAVENPPQDLLMAVDELRREIETDLDIESGRSRRVVRRLEMGDELCPDAWLRNDADGWSEVRPITQRKPVVRIAVNVSCHSGRKRKELLYRGAAAAALADVLHAQGYSPEIVGISSTRNTSADCGDEENRVVATVMAKRSDMPMDLPAVAFALSEIAFYRMVFINAKSRVMRTTVSAGWGQPSILPECVAAEFDIVIDHEILSKRQAVEFVRQYSSGITVEGQAA